MSATMPLPFAEVRSTRPTGDKQPCVVCNRPVRDPRAAVNVEMVEGGGTIARPGTADTSDPGYMGLFPVGPECARRIPAEFRA